MASKGEGKKKVPHRLWTKAEEEALLAAVKSLVVSGCKTDNGFKAGTYRKLETEMLKLFPGSDIKGKPHIESKITGWKRTYAQLRDILGTSGIGFNLTGENRIDCGAAQWEELCGGNDTTKKWIFKSWDYLEDWKLIFGKDRATGEGAIELIDMVNDLMHDSDGHASHIPNWEDIDMNEAEDVQTNSVADDSPSLSASGATKRSKNKRKRQFDDSISTLVDLVGEMQEVNVKKYESFQETFVKKAALNKARADIWSILQDVPGLSLNDAFEVGEILMDKPSRFEFFLALSEEARIPYLARLLAKRT